MLNRYQFESEVYESLDRMPLEVRMKLDSTGARISLKDWGGYTLEERRALCNLPVEAEEKGGGFVSYLLKLVLKYKYKGEDLELVVPTSKLPWEDKNEPPPTVLELSQSFGISVSSEEWARWDSFQRYALYKLSISKNEPEIFHEALEEFREGSCGPS